MKKIIYGFVFVLMFVKVTSQTINYSFSAVAGTYTANSGATQIVAPGTDIGISSSTSIGFTFQFGCRNYTTFQASANGVMFLGTTAAASNDYNDLTGCTDRPIIAPLWDDLATTNNANGGQVNYVVTGTSPNRVLTVEWKNMKWDYSATNANYAISFQAKLYETSNRIEFVYLRNGNATANLISADASIGLGGFNTGDFYSLDGVGASPNASKVTETTTLSSKPATGQIYRWDPVVCSGTPTAGTASASPSIACGGYTTTLNLTGNTSSCGITYQWYYSNAAAGTYTAIGTATTISTQTFAVNSTTYFKCVVTCGASSATTSAISASISPNNAGTGSSVVSLPYSASGLTNCGAGNDITPSNASAICGSSSYYDGEDAVYIFTPTVSAAFGGTLTSGSSYVGMTLYQGCPTTTGVCVAYSQSSSGNQSISCSPALTAGQTYYLVVDAYPSPTCHPTYALNLNMLTCSSTPTAGTAAVSPSVNCGSYTASLTLTGSSSSCGTTYQWFYASASGGPYTSVAPASSTTSQTFAVSSTTYFKAVVTCGATSVTASVISASISPLAGTGTYSISIPYSSGAQTTCGKVNDVTSSNVTTVCGSSSYFGGEDVLYAFTPTVTSTFTANVTSTGSYMGVMLYQGCPSSGGTCLGYAQSSAGNQTLSGTTGCSAALTVSAGVTYYLMLDSYPTPTCNPYSLTISSASVTGASTVAPCNFNYTAASTTFSFESFTGTSLPLTDDVLFADYIDFGFPFCFDGKSYTGGYVASNSSFVMDAVPCYPNISTSTYAAGGVSTGYSISAPAPVNGTSIPRNAILAPWHDINPSPTYSTSTTKIQYLISGTSPNRKAVISWEDVPMFDCETDLSILHSSQVKIFEYDGHIEIHIKQKRRCAGWNGQDAVLGLHNYNGTVYIPPVNATAHNYPTNWDMTNTAYTFTTPCNNQAGCLTILPITYKEFHGDKIDGVNTLWWSTASEENLSYFIVERSQNGVDFTDIDRVNAKNIPSEYRYKDYNAPEGIINYYRIRSVDVFGKEERTGIISIMGDSEDLLTTWPIYPNPTKKEVFVRLNAKKTGDANIIIYDIVGNKVIEQNEKIEAGVKVYGIDIESLKSGIYFVEIQNSLNEVITKQKLIIE